MCTSKRFSYHIILLLTVLSFTSSNGQQTANYITKFSTPPSIINSVLYESSGRIGLGTTTPSYRLDALGSGDEKFRLTSSAAGLGAAMMFWNSANTYHPRMEWQMVPSSTDQASYLRANYLSDLGNNSNLLVIKGTGSIGLYTTTPVNRLDVNGNQVIGSAYAGITTAPTNGLLVQGNVGIGKASPAYSLDVAGTIQCDYLTIGSTGQSQAFQDRVKIIGTSKNTGVTSFPALWAIQSGYTTDGVLNSNTSWGLYGENDDGAVAGQYAIGVEGRSENQAQNSGGTCIGGNFYGSTSSQPGTGIGGKFGASGPAAHAIEIQPMTAGTGRYGIYSAGTVHSYFAGAIGIGSDVCTGDMLTVNGQVHASSYITNALFCDYVFDDSYKLMPLNEVEERIKAEKHLPGIPSAKEVESNGLNIGDMEVKMMQKIEELTLYVINQNKEIKKLQEQNNELKVRVSSIAK